MSAGQIRWAWRAKRSPQAMSRKTVGVLLVSAVLSLYLAGAGTLRAVTVQSAQPPASSGGALLSEVLWAPRAGQTPFVEIVNAGQSPVDLTLWSLLVGDADVLLRRVTDPLAPGEHLLIRFDGAGAAERRAISAGKEITLPAAGGTVELRDAEDAVVDRVAWTGADAGAVEPAGLKRPASRSGYSIGRPPGAVAVDAPSEWVSYPPESVTPGARNPLPPVVDLSPTSGAVLDQTTVELRWMPVPGAATYHVQIAGDASFTSPIHDTTVKTAELTTPALAPRAYAWRVEAIAADGTRAPFSAASQFEVLAAVASAAGRAGVVSLAANIRRAPELEQSTGRRLTVPFLTQHKDTEMLHLEIRERRGTHAWDVDHGAISQIDPADTQNCAAANIAMVNRFYGGNLSQDRINWEVLGPHAPGYSGRLQGASVRATIAANPNLRLLDEVQRGPEKDFPYGKGLNGVRVTAAILFALGVEPAVKDDYTSPDELFGDVIEEIDAGRPVIVANDVHTFTITGYTISGTRRLLHLNDPAVRPYPVNVDRWFRQDLTVWKIPPGAQGRRQEPTVSADSDRDDVVDFDEVERFGTNPNDPDSDADGVKDKEDVASGVFELEHPYGYAIRGGTRGRDFDGDTKPTELDVDSDDGGCKDGDEDSNGDGTRAGPEHSNFDRTDDECGDLFGSVTYTSSFKRRYADGALAASTTESLTIIVSFRRDPQDPEALVDAGSRFFFHRVAHLHVANGDCPMDSRSVSAGQGIFTGGPGNEIGGRVSEGVLVMGAGGPSPEHVTADSCLGSGSMDQETSFSFPDCDARRVSGAAEVYEFNCQTPPDAGPGESFSVYSVTGRVRVLPASGRGGGP